MKLHLQTFYFHSVVYFQVKQDIQWEKYVGKDLILSKWN